MKKNLIFALTAALCTAVLPSCDKNDDSAAPAEAAATTESPTPAEVTPPAEVAAPAVETPAEQTPAVETPAVEAAVPAEASTPAEPAQAPETAVTDHVSLLKACIACFEEINASLDTVTDKASADAAATKLTPVCLRIQQLLEGAGELGEPTAEVLNELKPLEQQFQTAFGNMIGKLAPIAPDYYGSAALKTLFESL